MLKKDIVESIFQNSPYLRQDIKNIVDQVFEIMALGLSTEDKIMINNFGTFEKVYQEDYYGINANTGEKQLFKGGYRVRFTSSKNLKQKINDKDR